MTTTRRFGLTREGLTQKDADLVDLVLATTETHRHQGGAKLADPTLPPTGVLATTGGALAAGTTFFYRESWIDQFGAETAAGPEFQVTTPAPVSEPSAPVLTPSSGGALAQGPTYYALSAVLSATSETALGPPALVSITDFRKVSVKSGLTGFPDSVIGYHVWRQGPRDVGFTKLGLISDITVPFLDDGSIPPDPCACDPTNLPPASNLTNATSKVTITTSDPTAVGAPTGGSIFAWRLYRSTQSGTYGNSTLLVEINTTVNPNGTGGLVTTYVDDGSVAPQPGTPLNYSRTLTPTPRISNIIVSTFSALPDPAQLVDGIPAFVIDTRTQYAVISHAWVAIDNPPLVVASFVNLPATTNFLVGQEAIVRDSNELYVLLPAIAPQAGNVWQKVGGGPPNVGNPVLITPDSRIPYSVDMSQLGELVAVGYSSYGTPYPLGAGPMFENSTGTEYFRLGIEENGALVTYTDVVRTTDTVYPPSLGPLFQETPNVAYQLGVADDGCLTVTLIPTVYAHADAPIFTSPNGTHYRLVYDAATGFPTSEPVQ